MDSATHWEAVYAAKDPTQVSWYQPHLAASLALIARTSAGPEARLIDVGGGASTLVDDLLEKGWRHLSVLDVSSKALAASRARLGGRADAVTWITADITATQLPHASYDVWHDRAVFHFLTDAADRARYANAMSSAVKPGGHVLVVTFSLQGPPKCSGLEVVRYSPDTLQQALGSRLALVDAVEELHRTPFGTDQAFLYCWFRTSAPGSEGGSPSEAG